MEQKVTRIIDYDKAIADNILELVSSGMTYIAIMKAYPRYPSRRMYSAWQRGEHGAPSTYGSEVLRVRLDAADHRADEVIEFADDEEGKAHIEARQAMSDAVDMGILKPQLIYGAVLREAQNRIKEQIAVRKWVASRMNPKMWGDRMALDVEATVLASAKIDLSKMSNEELEKLEAMQDSLDNAGTEKGSME